MQAGLVQIFLGDLLLIADLYCRGQVYEPTNRYCGPQNFNVKQSIDLTKLYVYENNTYFFCSINLETLVEIP